MADTIVEFDSVDFDYYYQRGQKSNGVLFKKSFDDGKMQSFEIVSSNKRTLNLQTMYMEKGDYTKKKSAKSLLMDNPSANAQGEDWSNFDNSITEPNEKVNTKFSDRDDTTVYDLMGERDRLLKENERFKADIERLNERLKIERTVTHGNYFNENQLGAVAGHLRKIANSNMDKVELMKALKDTYSFISQSEQLSWEDVFASCYNIAEAMLKDSKPTYEVDHYSKAILDDIRNSKISLSEAQKEEAKTRFGNNWNRNFLGKANITDKGTPIESMWREWSEQYPGTFDAETNPIDMLEELNNIIGSLQDASETITKYNEVETARWLANEIYNQYWNVSPIRTTADKYDKRIKELNYKHRNAMSELREQRDEKVKEQRKKDKEKYLELAQKLREQRDEKVSQAKERGKERVEKIRDTSKRKVLRDKIMRHTSDLNKKLIRPTDKQHIPQELQNAVLNLLRSINLESGFEWALGTDGLYHRVKADTELGAERSKRTKAFLALKEVYEEIAENNDYGITIAPELLGSKAEGIENIFDEVTKLKDKRIDDMTQKELTQIYKAIRLVEHSISTANKMFAAKKWETLTGTAKAFEESVATRKPKKSSKENYIIDFETPITFFSHFGEAGSELYKALREAQDRSQTMSDEIKDTLSEFVSLEDRQKAEKDFVEITTSSGKKLTLSQAHIMNIYLLNNRDQGKKHLLYDPDKNYFGNGIRQPEIKKKKIGRGTEDIRLTKEDIALILSNLDEEYKSIADKLQKTTLRLAEWGNEASMEVFGYEKFNDPDYWTINSAPEGTSKSIEKNKNIARSIKNMGSAQSINDKATNALEIDSVFKMFDQHTSDMICYSAWLAVIEDATKLYNFKLRDKSGNKTGVTFQDLINNHAGKGGSDYFLNLLSDIQNGIGNPPDTKIERVYTSLYGKAAKAKVAFKATVVAQQPMAIIRASTVLNPSSLLKAAGKGAINLPAWGVSKAKNILPKQSGQLLGEWYGGWEKALKYAPIAARKAAGGYEMASNSSGLESTFYKPETIKGKAIDALKESPLWAAGKADEVTWGVLWNACEFETNRKKDLEKGSDAYYEAVAELFNKVVNETQVVDGVLQRSQIMRSSSAWVKPITAFKGEPIMGLNAIMRAYDQLRYETDKTKKKQAGKTLGKAATVFAVNAIFTAFARSLAVGLVDDDDEKYWEKVWTSFSGIKGDEETWFDYVKNIGLNSDVVNNINPFSWLPFTSEIMSAIQGYDSERLDVASIGEFVDAATKFIDSMSSDSKTTFIYATRNMLSKFAELTGYSPYNLIKDIEGAIYTFRVENDDFKGVYDMQKWRTRPASDTSTYIDILFKAYSADSEDYELIYNDMIKSGVPDKKIKSGMESRMKKAEGVDSVYDLSKRYMTPKIEKKYDAGLDKIKKTETWKSANKTQKKEAEDDLYEFLTSDSDRMKELREEAKAHGVDETEYALWSLALEMVDQPKDVEGNGSHSSAEKVEAINMLDLDDEEIAYFYGKGLQEYAKEELNEVLEDGIDVKKYVNFKAATSEMKADKYPNGKSIPNSKKRKIVNYMSGAGLTKEEWNYFYYEIMDYKK